MQPNQVSVRSVPSSEGFVKPPQRTLASSKGGAETQQEQGRPALAMSYALRGEVLQKSHPASKHLGTASQHIHTHEAAQGASAIFLKHAKVLSH